MDHFKEIYSGYKHRVYFFVAKYLSEEEDIEEIVQDIFMHVWKYLSKTNSPSEIEALIFKSAKQEISNFYRKRKMIFVPLENSPENQDEESSEIEKQLQQEDQLKKIENLLEQVPERSREFFIQNKIQNLSLFTIAQENDISKTAVEKHVNKVLKFLRANLNLLF
ncbi:RNA polymerase sigma-70 factor (ECF subfamily) [Chryseobacterium sediminis]|uniref:RNA polymerase sigma-70 factor (ECF subfamily) n=1 Tax=Chryseobacterium sediminis TaxID=1679494 RepID=A0ABR6PWM9_9FLAO|nr:sigma-70 family RNA polymerase sigma factor [Chryseobacterium sediminis]MBB6330087.1 RNA polymerase sigma-70 factor (ECF subfamily) [Chryseobacterium sediminis]